MLCKFIILKFYFLGVQKSGSLFLQGYDKGKNTSFGLIFTLLTRSPQKWGDIHVKHLIYLLTLFILRCIEMAPIKTYEWPSKMHNQAMGRETKRLVLIFRREICYQA